MKNILKSIKAATFFHTATWMLLIAITYFVGLQVYEGDNLLGFTARFLGNFSLFIATFYLFFSLLVPKVLRRRWWLFLLMGIGLYLVFFVLRHYIDHVIFEFDPSKRHYALFEDMPKHRVETRLTGGLILYVFWAGIAVFVRLLIDWFRDEKLKIELKNQQLNSELAYLRSQVNPHFLFNTLNNIYALAYKKSEDTPAAIMKLSSMMRYMLYETNIQKVSLDKEIEHLNNYIELQKLRRKEQDWVDFQLHGDVSTKVIAPLLLVPLLENAFKHSTPKSRIEMRLEVNANHLQFYITNEFSPHEPKDAVGGVGLQNIKRRLQLIYPEAHQMEIRQLDGRFEVNLHIELNPAEVATHLV
jgi:two-component system, LytTR family, sensor kinase